MATFSRPGVFIQEVQLPQTIALADNGTAAGAFICSLPKGPVAAPVLLTNWSDFVTTFGGLQDAYPATWAAYSFFANGGRQLYIKRVVSSAATSATITLNDASSGSAPTISVTAANPGSWGNGLSVLVSTTGSTTRFGLTVYGSPTLSGASTSNILEQFNDLSMSSTDPRYFVKVIAAQATYITAADLHSTSTSPTNLPLAGATLYALTGGSDGTTLTTTDYSTAITAFDTIQNPLIIHNPDAAYNSSSNTANTLSAGVVQYASTRTDCFAIVDVQNAYTAASSAQDAFTAIKSVFAASSTGSNAAGYWPWVAIPDALSSVQGAVRYQAPGPIMVGQFLATDASRGVFKTPAGLANKVALAVDTAHRFTNAELDAINTSVTPVNAIRYVPGAGIVVMGGRTMDNTPGNRYINVKRSLIYIEKELTLRSQYAIFENNDERLWSSLRTALGNFLRGYWQQGGLKGANIEDAYFVKCDTTTTSASDIQNGRVNIQIGVALQNPAEFIVINISQLTGSATA